MHASVAKHKANSAIIPPVVEDKENTRRVLEKVYALIDEAASKKRYSTIVDLFMDEFVLNELRNNGYKIFCEYDMYPYYISWD